MSKYFAKNTIKKNLQHSVELIILDSVDSTNTYLQNLKPSTATACIADQQTMGRGQFAREWHSPSGNIYLSLAYPFDKSSGLNAFSLVAGVAVCINKII